MSQGGASTYALAAPSVGQSFGNRVSKYRQVRRLMSTVPPRRGAPRTFRLLDLGPDEALMQHVTRTYAHRAPFGGTLSQACANDRSNHSDNRSSSHSDDHWPLPPNPKPSKSGVDRRANACPIVFGHPRAKAHSPSPARCARARTTSPTRSGHLPQRTIWQATSPMSLKRFPKRTKQ